MAVTLGRIPIFSFSPAPLMSKDPQIPYSVTADLWHHQARAPQATVHGNGTMHTDHTFDTWAGRSNGTLNKLEPAKLTESESAGSESPAKQRAVSKETRRAKATKKKSF